MLEIEIPFKRFLNYSVKAYLRIIKVLTKKSVLARRFKFGKLLYWSSTSMKCEASRNDALVEVLMEICKFSWPKKMRIKHFFRTWNWLFRLKLSILNLSNKLVKQNKKVELQSIYEPTLWGRNVRYRYNLNDDAKVSNLDCAGERGTNVTVFWAQNCYKWVFFLC